MAGVMSDVLGKAIEERASADFGLPPTRLDACSDD
jgi:hypothetical protein